MIDGGIIQSAVLLLLAGAALAAGWGMMRGQVASLRRDVEELRGTVRLHISDGAEVFAQLASLGTSVKHGEETQRAILDELKELRREMRSRD